MTSSKGSIEAESTSPNNQGSADESEDESEVLEESPCGRWQKRREEVKQRDVPGIDQAFLAMDNDQGIEVVWNEVLISEKKSSRSQEEKIKQVFDNLINLDHVNIVTFHNYWTDTHSGRTDTHAGKPRVIFITEYMSSGSLKQFLKKTKKNNRNLKAWKRWCTQILSALSYLHSCEPPIIHGNLRSDTIFIQHNGLIKIGSVAPDAIYNHLKTVRKEMKDMHYNAPEYGGSVPVTTAVDIYSFGICALEMAVLEIPGNGDTGKVITEESIRKTLASLDDPLQRDFISKCLEKDPSKRPAARELLFHAVLFEVHSLKLLAAHILVKNGSYLEVAENQADEITKVSSDRIVAEIIHYDGRPSPKFTMGEMPKMDMEKLFEDVRNGVYPLTAFAQVDNPLSVRPRAMSPEVTESTKSETPEPVEVETRLVTTVECHVKRAEANTNLHMTIVLRMSDQMNRRLSCDFSDNDSSYELARELVTYGFIHEGDCDKMCQRIEESRRYRDASSSPPHLIEQKA